MAHEWSEDIAIADLTDEPALSEELATLIDRVEATSSEPSGRTPHVVLNLGLVTYVNSSNIAQLLQLRTLLTRAGRRLRLCSVNEEVVSVIAVTGLDRLFEIVHDPLTALAGLQLDDQ
jgi:anti-anti-sigma factor